MPKNARSPSALAIARARAVWASPRRAHATLQAFAVTEEDGAKDLEAAARRIADPVLRGHVLRHAEDEWRHASILRARAAEMVERAGASAEGADARQDMARVRPAAIESHGFYSAGLYDELGEVAYVAMLHVAEMRAARHFALHARAARDDAATRAVFDEILIDEKYHVAYTAKILDRWRSQGRGREVDEGLKRARSSRFVGEWKRLGLRSGAGLGRVLLLVAYFTVLVPSALFARRQRFESRWRSPRATTPGSQA